MIDSITRSDLPDALNEPVVLKFVKTYQIHQQSKTCRKYRIEKCRFHFGNLFISCTIITQLSQDHIPQHVRHEKMQRGNAILEKVKNYIDDELNPSRKNFLDNTKDDYEK